MEDYKNKKLTYEDLKNIPIENLGMSNRARNALARNGIKNVADLIVLSDQKLRRMRNIGDKTVKEVYDIIESIGNEEVTSNMSKLDAFTIGIKDAEKEEYIKDYFDIILEFKLNDIDIHPYAADSLNKKGINSVLDLVLSTEERLQRINIWPISIDDIKNELARFNLHLGMTKTEINELVSPSKESSFKKDFHHIDDVNELLRERNRNQQVENDFSKAKLDVLKLLSPYYSNEEELSDIDKEKILETIELIEEGKKLKEEKEKIEQDIYEYINKLERSSYIMDQKIKTKKKEDKNH